jgi:hypothetical protein
MVEVSEEAHKAGTRAKLQKMLVAAAWLQNNDEILTSSS